MESLAERYVDAYERAIDIFARGSTRRDTDPYTRGDGDMTVIGPSGGTGTVHDGGGPSRAAGADRCGHGRGGRSWRSSSGAISRSWRPCRPTSAALERVHSAAYLQRLEEFCRAGGGDLDPDTFARPDSWEAALLSAGAGLQAIDAAAPSAATAWRSWPPGLRAITPWPIVPWASAC